MDLNNNRFIKQVQWQVLTNLKHKKYKTSKMEPLIVFNCFYESVHFELKFKLNVDNIQHE